MQPAAAPSSAPNVLELVTHMQAMTLNSQQVARALRAQIENETSPYDPKDLVAMVESQVEEFSYELKTREIVQLAEGYVSSEDIVSGLINESWKTLHPKVRGCVHNKASATNTINVIYEIYLLYLQNGQERKNVSEIQQNMPMLLTISEKSHLVKRVEHARGILQEVHGGKRPAAPRELMEELCAIKALTNYASKRTCERFCDFPHQDRSQKDKMRALHKQTLDSFELIVEASSLRAVFAQHEIQKRQREKAAPTQKQESAFYNSYADPLFFAACRFLKELLVVAAKGQHPENSPLLTALQRTCNKVQKRQLSKIMDEPTEKLFSRFDDQFLNAFWDIYYDKSPGFDITTYIKRVVATVTPATQLRLKTQEEALRAKLTQDLKACTTEEAKANLRAVCRQLIQERVYEAVFAPLKATGIKINDIQS